MSNLKNNTTQLQNLLTQVNNLPNAGGGGTDTSDATATSADILSGKTAYAKGDKITGTIPTKTSSDLTASGATVTVPAGYYATQATKSVATATQATPSISIDANGKITASATQTAGYVTAGTKSGTSQMTIQAAKTITPSTSSQTAVAKNVYTTGVVTVAAIPSNYEDVGTETNTYTSLNTELEAVINSLPNAGSGGSTPTETMEEWFSGDATFDVTNAATFIAHTPQIMYADITDLSQVTDQNTLYTMPDGLTYILSVDANGSYSAMRGELQCDVNGFDALVPIIEESGGSGGGSVETCTFQYLLYENSELPICFLSGWTWEDFINSPLNSFVSGYTSTSTATSISTNGVTVSCMVHQVGQRTFSTDGTAAGCVSPTDLIISGYHYKAYVDASLWE